DAEAVDRNEPLLRFEQRAAEEAAAPEPSQWTIARTPAIPIPGTPIGEIFRTSGQPEYNFVEPAQATELAVRLRSMGEGLLVEGPSGVGKTTAVDRALRTVGQRQRTVWLLGTSSRDKQELDRLIQSDLQQGGHLVVDDFHHLEQERQHDLTALIKILADRNRR